MQIPELASKLQAIGLNDKEARVYVASLFLGPAAVQRIAEQAGVNRATTYVILGQLQEMGLVSESTEAKKTVYIAEGPEGLARWIADQEALVATRRKSLEALTDELQQAQRVEERDAPVIRFYRGRDGISSVLEESRRKRQQGDVVYGFSDNDEAAKILPDNSKKSPAARLKKKVSSKAFYYAKGKGLASDPKLLREVKKLAAAPKADISLSPGRATIITYRGVDSIAVVIESQEIVGALRQLFELAWENKPE